MAGNIVLHLRLQIHNPNLLEAEVLDKVGHAVTLLERPEARQWPLVPLERDVDFGFYNGSQIDVVIVALGAEAAIVVQIVSANYHCELFF